MYMYVKVENICIYYRPEVYFSLKINIFQKQSIDSFKVKKTSLYNTRICSCCRFSLAKCFEQHIIILTISKFAINRTNFT